ncbi:acylphosphatase [Beijerinckia mobilis]|uniref:acylphosphatase n=1 Tax=Beijerinckia mobilis TaxID=231434 RepID=UPI000552CF65|nr:acylphosphatase [Beijerinckia mobilis]
MSDTQLVHLRIIGRVQGVGYRAWTVGEARRLGLGGFVRNKRNGNVEAVLIGASETIAVLVELCRSGPPAARVDQIEQAIINEEMARILAEPGLREEACFDF